MFNSKHLLQRAHDDTVPHNHSSNLRGPNVPRHNGPPTERGPDHVRPERMHAASVLQGHMRGFQVPGALHRKSES